MPTRAGLISAARCFGVLSLAVIAALPRNSRQTGVLRLEWTVEAAASLSFTRISGPHRLVARHQLKLAIADEIRASHLPQRLAQHGPVVRVVIAQERLV